MRTVSGLSPVRILLAVLCAALLAAPAAAQGGKASDADRLFREAMRLAEQKRYREALEKYKALTSLRPDAVAAWFNMGVVCLRMGNTDGARWAFRNVHRLDPKNEPALRALLQIAVDGNDAESARQYGRALSAMKPRDPAPHMAEGILSLRAGKAAEAEAAFGRAAGLDPKNAGAWANLGLARMRQKKFRPAAAAFERAAQAEPGNPQLRLMAADAYREAGDLVSAGRLLESAVKMAPADPRARLAYGAVLDQ